MAEKRNHEMIKFTKTSNPKIYFLSTSLTLLVFIFSTIINQTAAIPCKCERHKYNLCLIVSLLNRLLVKGLRQRKWVKQDREGKESSKTFSYESPSLGLCPVVGLWSGHLSDKWRGIFSLSVTIRISHCALVWLHQQKANSQALSLSEWTWQLQAPRPPSEGHSITHRPVRWLRDEPRAPAAATPCQLHNSERK